MDICICSMTHFVAVLRYLRGISFSLPARPSAAAGCKRVRAGVYIYHTTTQREVRSFTPKSDCKLEFWEIQSGGRSDARLATKDIGGKRKEQGRRRRTTNWVVLPSPNYNKRAPASYLIAKTCPKFVTFRSFFKTDFFFFQKLKKFTWILKINEST